MNRKITRNNNTPRRVNAAARAGAARRTAAIPAGVQNSTLARNAAEKRQAALRQAQRGGIQ